VSETSEATQTVDDPEREARRRLALAQVRQYPDPVLRLTAREVQQFDAGLGELVSRMSALMRDANGVGLAAPQVGVSQRVLVYQLGDEEPLVALVNPRVVESAEDLGIEEEGCLSLGASSVVVEVERPLTVVVAATSPEGEAIRIEAEGLEARVVQHEIDHLDGILTIDRTTPEHRRAALALLRPPVELGPLPRA
jgi:peptide deformylase